MRKIILFTIILISSSLFCQSTYTEFKNSFKRTIKKYDLVDKTSPEYSEAIDAYESGQNPVFKRLIKRYFEKNEKFDTYIALAQYFDNTGEYRGVEMCRWVLEQATDKWPKNVDAKYFLAFVYEKLAREYRTEDISNRLFMLKAESTYEELIENDPKVYLAKYHLARYALEGIEEFHNSYVQSIEIPKNHRRDGYVLMYGEKIGGKISKNKNTSYGDRENFIIKNSVNAKTRGNGEFIVNDAKKILIQYKPKVFNNRDFDYSKLLIKMHFINKEFKKCIEVIDQKDQSIVSYKDFLMRGVCNHNLRNYKEANKDFHIAIKYMDEGTRNDFIFNSFGIILGQKYGDNFYDGDENIKKQYILAYLRLEDPLYLTTENERLLEHYYRVAYSNLFFGFDIDNRREKEKGWETDRGEVFIRYGNPLEITRLRPDASFTKETLDKSAKLKTEVWNYLDKKFAFVDKFSNNNYVFAENVGGTFGIQDVGSTNEFIESYRIKNSDEYKFESQGTAVNVSYNLYQLKNPSESLTDIILSYQINENDSICDLYNPLSYTTGLYLIDDYTNIIDSKTNKFQINSRDKINDVTELSLKHQAANVSFEILRNNDNGAYSNKGRIYIKDFTDDDLQLSDIILADKVEFNKKVANAIIRRNISVIPSSKKELTVEDALWIYFEIYNLELEDRFNKFSQNIEIQKIDEDGSVLDSFSKIGEFIGLSDGSDVKISSKYQTTSVDEQIYFKLDMSEMETGTYRIIINVEDQVQGEEISKRVTVNFKN